MSLIYRKKNHIAYFILDRPEARNAVDPATAVQLYKGWRDYRDDENCRCAIITGAGEKAFCSGMDLGKMIPLLTGARAPQTEAEYAVFENPRLLEDAMLRGFELYKPVIAAVNGDAIAGGMEIMIATDIRIACDSARFGLQEVKWALFPKGGSTVRLPHQIPYCKAMEIMLTGELISAPEALRIGLINQVVPYEDLITTAEAIATRIASNGPLATRAIKESVIKTAGMKFQQALAKEAEMAKHIFNSIDAKEGPKAFKEKRLPKFIGK